MVVKEIHKKKVYILHWMLTVHPEQMFASNTRYFFVLYSGNKGKRSYNFSNSVFNLSKQTLLYFPQLCANKVVFSVYFVTMHTKHDMGSGYTQSMETHYILWEITKKFQQLV